MNGKKGMTWVVSSRTNADVRRLKLARQLAYRRWDGMMKRCYDEENASYDNYGGRGIHVDEAWHDFKRYHADVGDPPQHGLTIDRPERDESYGPENWRWATLKEQAANRRPRELPHSNALSFIYDNGKLLTTREAARRLGCKPGTLAKRLGRYRAKDVFEHDLKMLRAKSPL